MIQAEAIVAAARSLLGTPFVHQGRLPGVGIDCAGVVVCTARVAGCAVKDWSCYRRLPIAEQVVEALRGMLDRDEEPAREAGRVGLFWVRRPAATIHLGIFTAPDFMIHSVQSAGKVVEIRLDDHWAPKLDSTWSFRLG